MAQALVVAALLCIAGPLSEQDRKALEAIRNFYEANRAALSSAGTIRFHSCDGVLSKAPSVEAFDALLKGGWERRSPSQGVYYLDGEKRRLDNLYSPREIVARRTKLSSNSWSSIISPYRLLTDGETTLCDPVSVADDGDSILHSPNLRAGTGEFFRLAGLIPINLGNPDASVYDLGKCLERVLEMSEGARLVEIDDRARLGGVPVVRLTVETLVSGVDMRLVYWVDMEHGAIPLQSRASGYVPHAKVTVFAQYDHGDIRWVEKGWLPFRSSTAEGNLTADGSVSSMFVREVVIDEADFTRRPDRSVFSMEFPEEYGLSDSDRRLGFGKRRVWDVNDFSAQARARARRIGVSNPVPGPEMPPARSPWTWSSLFYVAVGTVLLLAAGSIAARRVFHG